MEIQVIRFVCMMWNEFWFVAVNSNDIFVWSLDIAGKMEIIKEYTIMKDEEIKNENSSNL